VFFMVVLCWTVRAELQIGATARWQVSDTLLVMRNLVRREHFGAPARDQTGIDLSCRNVGKKFVSLPIGVCQGTDRFGSSLFSVE
jgi:hypothetical protein